MYKLICINCEPIVKKSHDEFYREEPGDELEFGKVYTGKGPLVDPYGNINYEIRELDGMTLCASRFIPAPKRASFQNH